MSDSETDPASPRAVGERLQQARREAQVRQSRDIQWRELADAAGMHTSAMPLVQRGERRLSLQEVRAMATVLEVRAAWLAWGEPPAWPSRAGVGEEPAAPMPPAAQRRAR